MIKRSSPSRVPESMKVAKLSILCFLCLFVASHAGASVNPQRYARTVTIYRDTYGVPHVFGRTDASTVFGFAYAQAEDNFWRVE